MSRFALPLLVALGSLRDPSCGTETPAGGPNAPCTRPSDCQGGLECTHGACVSPDAGASDATSGDASDAGVPDAADAAD